MLLILQQPVDHNFRIVYLHTIIVNVTCFPGSFNLGQHLKKIAI